MSVLEPGKTVSMDDIIRQQAELEEDAAEAIPFSFTSCTFGNNSMHEAKQPLYSCLSCRPHPLQNKDRAGICAGCSVSCHGDCELVELFSRRDFVCDCGTSKIPGKKCSLTLRQDDAPSTSNKYDANFDGIFCACQTRYDPETETCEMIQCLVCEDWYHTTKCLAKGITSNNEDNNPLHPDIFDTFVCETCVLGPASKTIARYAGRPGFMVLSGEGSLTSDLARTQTLAPTLENERTIVETQGSVEEASSPAVQVASSTSLKRAVPDDNELDGREGDAQDDGPSAAKSQKIEEETEEKAKSISCTAPPLVNQALLDATLPRKDIYLEDGWRESLCRCEECLRLYEGMPYLLTEEEVYEPPEDQDAGKSLLDLGTEALLQMPREQAVHGLEAYTGLRDKLMKYLKPFAREGKIVKESDIQEFFEAEKRRKAELTGGR